MADDTQHKKKNVWRIVVRVLAALLLTILALPFTLYIPAVSSYVKDIATAIASESTGWQITASSLDIDFPLTVSLTDVTVITAPADTMIQAGRLEADIAVLPLLTLRIEAETITAEKARYCSLLSDSTLSIIAAIDKCSLKESSLSLSKNAIAIGEAIVDGADITIDFDMYRQKAEEPDTAATEPWLITAHGIALKNVAYRMTMLPTIDSLSAVIGCATLNNGVVNTVSRKVNAKKLLVDGLDVAYFTPTEQILATLPPLPETAAETPYDTVQWTVTASEIGLRNANATYAIAGSVPTKGLDFNHISCTGIEFDIADFYNRGTSVIVPLKHLTATERCGLTVSDASVLFKFSNESISCDSLQIVTTGSSVTANMAADAEALELADAAAIAIKANAVIAPDDISMAFPDIARYLSALNPIVADIDANGSVGDIVLNSLSLSALPLASLRAKGRARNMTSESKRNISLAFNGNIPNAERYKKALLSEPTASIISIPGLKAEGKLRLNGDVVSPDVAIHALDGTLAVEGSLNMNNEAYDLAVNTSAFPIDAFLRDYPFGSLTASIGASGRGFDLFSPSTSLDASLAVDSLWYNFHKFTDITANAALHDSQFAIALASPNRIADISANIDGSIDSDCLNYNLSSEIGALDMRRLALSADSLSVAADIKSNGIIDLPNGFYDCIATISGLSVNIGNEKLSAKQIDMKFVADSTSTQFKASEGDMVLSLTANERLLDITPRFSLLAAELDSQLVSRRANIDAISQCLPEFNLYGRLAKNNCISRYLRYSDITFDSIDFNIGKDSLMHADADAYDFRMGATTLDTISIRGYQEDNSFVYMAKVNNRPGNLDQFSSSFVTGTLADNNANMLFYQTNSNGVPGFYFGADASIDGDDVRMTLFPENPIIGFRKWTLNPDNYIKYNLGSSHIDANVNLESDAGYLAMYTKHVSDTLHEDLIVTAKGINLGEWLNMAPWLPEVNGMLNTDININNSNGMLTGFGTFSLADILYNRKTLGNVEVGFGLGINPQSGKNEAQAVVAINGHNAITVAGSINDTTATSPYDLRLSLDKFPLTVANPFLPESMLQLGGYLNGEMSMTGTMETPNLNGELMFDSTRVEIPVFGSRLKFDDVPVAVKENLITFNNFGIRGNSGDPLLINGTIDIANMSNPLIGLRFNGNNVQVVDSKYTAKSQLFGKGFVGCNASASGRLSDLSVKAALTLLPKTDVTYVLQEDAGSLTRTQASDVVKFVCFADTLDEDIKPIESEQKFALNLNADMNISSGAVVNVNISPDGRNKAQVRGDGALSFSMNPLGEMRMTGRYNINNGFVRYNPPFISEKYFTFDNSSYIAFNGDILNPTLNIIANGTQASTVTTEGSNPVRVNFNIEARVTNTLSNMNIAFDLSAPNNSAVQSELQSLSPAQRSTQAINLMLYNSYSTGATSSAMATNANMLYSVLSSQINSLAQRMVKGVDLTFGINEYNSGNGSSSTGMNYSYQVSKSLFDNRFKVTVGGNYDSNVTDDTSIAQNLFSNVSFEYLITPSGSMSLKLFNRMSDNNIFQTQVNETGMAFVIRRKLTTLKDLFNFRYKLIPKK